MNYPFRENVDITIDRARAQGLRPKSIYLTDEDKRALYRELSRDGLLFRVDRGDDVLEYRDLPVRPVKGQGGSMVYCKHGVGRSIRPASAAPSGRVL